MDHSTADYKTVRSLLRGLDILQALNRCQLGRATSTELAQMTGLHRTTVRRLLETLIDAGYVRRSDSDDRADLPVLSYDAARGMVRIAPLAHWRDVDVEDYIARHGVLVNPLLELGYLSIGCTPCTRPVAPGADPRSGRWAGFAKTECGIH